MFRFDKKACVAVFILFTALMSIAADGIPKAAWKRGIGVPLENPGGRKPKLAPTGMIDDGYWQGAPVGGFGAGTLSRTYRGDFARWHLKTGVHKYESVGVNQFSMFQQSGSGEGYAQVLFAGKPEGDALKAWNWNYPVNGGTYYALYPKSWFEYPNSEKFPAKVTVEQFSPIIPGNYKETSYPLAVYRWRAENPSNTPVTVSVMFSWANMVGWLRDSSQNFQQKLQAGNFNRAKEESVQLAGKPGKMKGIVFDRNRVGPVAEDWDGQFVIASAEQPGVEVTTISTFDPGSDGSDVWKPFAKDGRLQPGAPDWNSSGETLAGAIAVRFTLQPHETKVVPMVLAWDLPIVEFGGGRKWVRKYTDFFNASGTNAWAIAKAGLQNTDAWSASIDQWQKPIADDESKPEWYRSMLFNEMYNIADLAGFWGRPMGSPASTPGTFGFLECYDYAFYNTLDVLFYGSMPLVKFWPEIDKQVMRAFADTIQQEDQGRYIWQWKTEHTGQAAFRQRKAKGAAPHDLGNPIEDPFKSTNQFSWQNTNGWKDLNSKFVLMVYRDYVLGGKDAKFLRDSWPAVKAAMQYLRQFDRNNDGLIENDGFPDQTYDEWVVRGESAYSGSLYLAALRASEEIGKVVGDAAGANEYRGLFNRAQKSFVSKLWNGEYFRYDTDSDYKDNIQAEQLAGQWYASLTGLGDIVPSEMRKTALKKVFDYNVMKFGKGEMGAANGMGPDGNIITTNQQVQEVWTGATFSVAALMLSEGLKEEAFHTAWGVYNVVWDKKGYWFRTPEAYEVDGMYRASMYMRPGSIWAMEMMGAGATKSATAKATSGAK